MSTKNRPGPYDCYAKATDDEEMFHLLGRDRHGSALVRLWAEMREREGEDPMVVAEAREVADKMEEQARALGKPVMTMESMVMFCTTLREAKEQAAAAPAAAPEASGAALQAGEIVMVGHGGAAKLVKIFTEPEQMGKANVQFARSPGVVTVDAIQLRRASGDEIEQYRLAGGRL